MSVVVKAMSVTVKKDRSRQLYVRNGFQSVFLFVMLIIQDIQEKCYY